MQWKLEIWPPELPLSTDSDVLRVKEHNQELSTPIHQSFFHHHGITLLSAVEGSGLSLSRTRGRLTENSALSTAGKENNKLGFGDRKEISTSSRPCSSQKKFKGTSCIQMLDPDANAACCPRLPMLSYLAHYKCVALGWLLCAATLSLLEQKKKKQFEVHLVVMRILHFELLVASSSVEVFFATNIVLCCGTSHRDSQKGLVAVSLPSWRKKTAENNFQASWGCKLGRANQSCRGRPCHYCGAPPPLTPSIGLDCHGGSWGIRFGESNPHAGGQSISHVHHTSRTTRKLQETFLVLKLVADEDKIFQV